MCARNVLMSSHFFRGMHLAPWRKIISAKMAQMHQSRSCVAPAFLQWSSWMYKHKHKLFFLPRSSHLLQSKTRNRLMQGARQIVVSIVTRWPTLESWWQVEPLWTSAQMVMRRLPDDGGSEEEEVTSYGSMRLIMFEL